MLKLHPHQSEGVEQILAGLEREKAFLLCDEQGLGKTIQSLAVVQRLKLPEPTLVVVPPQCVHIWTQGDAVKHFGNYFRITHFTGKSNTFVGNFNMYVVSYETLLSLYRGYICEMLDVGKLSNEEMLRFCLINKVDVKKFEELSGDNLRRELIVATRSIPYRQTGNMNRTAANKLMGIKWGIVICDEVHRLKNAQGFASEAVAFLQARYRLALSGSPLMNSANDLVSIMKFGLGLFHVTSANVHEFKRLMLRRTKEELQDALTIPKRRKLDEIQIIEWTDEVQKSVYIRIKAESNMMFQVMMEQTADVVERKQLRMSFMALLQKLRQTCIAVNVAPNYTFNWSPVTHNSFHPWIRQRVEMLLKCTTFSKDLLHHIICHFVRAAGRMVQPSPKMLEVYELLKRHHKIVVFSSFRAVIEDVIRPWLDQIGVDSALFAGGSRKEQERVAAEFDHNKNCRVLLVVKAAGGVGQNFQYASNVCVILDPHFNEALDEQVAGRVHRVGQTRDEVIIRKLFMRGSIDEAMRTLQVSKTEDINSWMSGSGGSASSMKMQGLFLSKYDTVK